MKLNIKNFRIIAVSATLPNIDDIATWLNVRPSGIKIFGSEYRPIKIEILVRGYKNSGNPFLFEKHLNYKLA